MRVPALSQGLCGQARPTHFDGVCLVVLKLFLITVPHIAVFGEKDWQQLQIIRRLVADLNIPVGVTPCATLRERDGLAMSSRNARLSAADRLAAGEIVTGQEADFPEALKDILGLYGAKAVINAPVSRDGVWSGFLGLADVRGPRQFTRQEHSLLSTAASLLSVYLARR